MKKQTMIGLIIAAVAGIMILMFFLMKASYKNTNVDMKQRITAQQQVTHANFDKMYKVIQQTAEVANAKFNMSKEAFKEIYPPLMEGRYSNDKNGMLMKLIVEQNPQFDLNAAGSLYDKLAIAIAANRQEFFIEQEKLIQYNKEQRAFVSDEKWPNNWFLNASDTIHIVIIESEVTKNVFKTGEENDIKLFENKSSK
jgi:hypothetical protein